MSIKNPCVSFGAPEVITLGSVFDFFAPIESLHIASRYSRTTSRPNNGAKVLSKHFDENALWVSQNLGHPAEMGAGRAWSPGSDQVLHACVIDDDVTNCGHTPNRAALSDHGAVPRSPLQGCSIGS